MFKKILVSPWTALLTLALVTALRIADPTFVESVRLRYFDTLVTSRPTETIGVDVVNIAVSYTHLTLPTNREV